MQSRFLQQFKRITYSTSYLPEIDGLRFLAIFSVVIILHISHYMDAAFYGSQLIRSSYWRNFVLEGGNGVALFFVISGFILSLPFARWRLNGEKKVHLGNYYLRRVTRLEPPYLIALALFFIADVYVINKYAFGDLFPHLMASSVYLHGIIYHAASRVLPVAWSLEVEVQFYLLAPLFFLIFLIRSRRLRWGLCLAVIAASAVYWFDVWKVSHVFMCLHYFFSGILLADLYCSKMVLFKNRQLGLVAGIAALLGFLFLPSLEHMPGFLAKIVCMFLLVHTVLTNPHMKKLFSAEFMVVIGGMCYSIYLLHFAIVSATGQLLKKAGLPVQNTSYALLWLAIFIAAVLTMSAAYFLLVEKPFMRPRGLKRPE
jgi:peptidoglycan/LPS O-acetylase OafA/YrhL